jgi:hypothetical protein
MADVSTELDDQRGGGKRYCRDYTWLGGVVDDVGKFIWLGESKHYL